MPASTNTSYARYKELLREMDDEKLMDELKKLRKNRAGCEVNSAAWNAWDYMFQCATAQARSRD